MIGKKFDSNKPDILEYFKKIPLTKKDFPKSKKKLFWILDR
jgi:hypothetical protein